MMTERIKELKPLIVCFNGKGTYESYYGDKCDWGLQPKPIPGTDTVSIIHNNIIMVVKYALTNLYIQSSKSILKFYIQIVIAS